MDDVLRLFREATGNIYDGSLYNLDDLQPDETAEADDGNESDIEVPIVQFSDSESEREDEEDEVLDGDGDVLDGDGDDGWSATTSNVPVSPFIEESGPNHHLDETAMPYDYFSLILTEDFYTVVAHETNEYAKWRQEKDNKADSVWYDTTPAEIKIYLSINILMGIHKLPSYTMYWSSDDRLRVPGVADVMSKNRYEKLSQYLHLNDSRRQPARGHVDFQPLYKVKPMLDMVQFNIAAYYRPNKNISLDEAMIAFHGRLAYKQYIKGKPHPWGIKVWCAADAETGYLLSFNIYTGRVNIPMPHGMGYHVIKELLGENYLHKYHHFFYDNYFSSIRLAEDLLQDQTYSCSTVRSNRKGWPKQCSAKEGNRMRKGGVKFMQRGNLVALGWKYKRHVTMLSTNTTPGMTTVQRRAPGGHVNAEVPSLVAEYNRSMGGVDRFDQLSSYYPVGRKSRKWWRYVFRFLIQTTIINSFILYSTSHLPKPKDKLLTQLQFRLSLCTSLVRGNVSRKRKGRPCAPSTAGLGTADIREHRLIRMTGNKGACFWCSKNRNFQTRGRAHETVFGCNLCQIHLGRGECFSNYHESLITMNS